MTAVHALVVAHVGNVKEMTNKPWWYASEHPYVCVYDGMQHIVHVLHNKMQFAKVFVHGNHIAL